MSVSVFFKNLMYAGSYFLSVSHLSYNGNCMRLHKCFENFFLYEKTPADLPDDAIYNVWTGAKAKETKRSAANRSPTNSRSFESSGRIKLTKKISHSFSSISFSLHAPKNSAKSEWKNCNNIIITN